MKKVGSLQLAVVSNGLQILTLVPTVPGGNAYGSLFEARSAFPRRSVGTSTKERGVRTEA